MGNCPGLLYSWVFGCADSTQHVKLLDCLGSLSDPGPIRDLLEWKTPAPIGKPAARANQLGLYRMAFMVEDIRACYDELRTQGVDCPAPVYLDMGPETPIDGLWALFFPDPDGTCMELIETPSFDDPT